MRGTKLWTESRSPLISGRSRHARSFTTEWLTGAIASAAGAGALVWVLVPQLRADLTGLIVLAAVVSVASLVGSGTGVTLARGMGWIRPWVAATALGLGASGLAAIATVTLWNR